MTSMRSRCSSLSSETTTLPPPLPSGNPWSTAFCSSSVSTTDSGVATRAGIRPPSPASEKCTGPVGRLQALLGEAQQRADDLDERDVVAGLPRQRLVDEGDRADPAHRLRHRRLGLRVLQPAGLQAQQRRDRLQVVLHPVVDLADRRVLADQQPVALAQVGDVADEQHAAGDLAAGQDRQAAAQQGDVRRLLELLDDRDPLLERLAHHVVVEAELGEAHADGVGVDADAVQRRVGVRRQVGHPAVGVEAHHAVADAGAAVESAPRVGYGNDPSAIISAKRSKIDT